MLGLGCHEQVNRVTSTYATDQESLFTCI